MALRRATTGSGVLLLFVLACLRVSSAQSSTQQVVAAADKFLATLSSEQRQKVVYAYNDAQQRARWSNFPTGFVPRGGINLKQMSPVERDAALNLLKTVLSPMGYEKVNQIRMADDDSKANGSRRGPRGGGPPGGNGGPAKGTGGPAPPAGPGGPPPNGQLGPVGGPGGRPPLGGGEMFGSDLYYISFLGKPSVASPWMLQFGGHHLALNITIAGKSGVMTPSLTGAQPATFKVDGKTIRPIGKENDLAVALLQSLDAQQRKQAILSYQVADLVLGPGQDGKRIAPEGLPVSKMTDKQKAALLDLIAE